MKAGVGYIGITTSFYCTDGKKRLLLHKRSKRCRDEGGTWDSGGGQIEFGLTPEENVLKEVSEEYACKGKIIKQLSPVNLIRLNQGKKTHWIALPFIILINPADVHIGDKDKIDEIGWFTFDALPEPLHSGFQKTYFTNTKEIRHGMKLF